MSVIDTSKYTATEYLPAFWGWTDFVPTIPKLYWDVRSQEQRILNVFKLVDKLVNYADLIASTYNKNADDIAQLQKDVAALETEFTQLVATTRSELEEQLAEQVEALEGKITQAEKDANAYTDEQLQDYATLAMFLTEQERVNVLIKTLQDAIDAVAKHIEEIANSAVQYDVLTAQIEETKVAQRDMFNYVTGNAMSCDDIATSTLTVNRLANSGLNVRGFAVNNMSWGSARDLAGYYRAA